MRLRSSIAPFAAWMLMLALAAPAMADEGGEGLYGKANDKVVTNFGFGLMIFFIALVTGLSLLQYLLDKRKRSK
jgi:hypothetical protein